jgi:predicted Zn-dependent protease
MLGNIQRAITLLEEILAKEPDYPPAMGRIAAAYIIGGREQDGLKYLRRLLERGYNCSMLIEEQAQALFSLGKTHEAMLLREAVRKLNGSARKSPCQGNEPEPTPDRLVGPVEHRALPNAFRHQVVQPDAGS